MSVLFFSPGFPQEMPYFVRGLAEVGVRVIGLGDQPAGALPDLARRHLAGYIEAGSLFDERSVIEAVQRAADHHGISQVECLWEPGMILAAQIREALGLPGMTVAETLPFSSSGNPFGMLAAEAYALIPGDADPGELASVEVCSFSAGWGLRG